MIEYHNQDTGTDAVNMQNISITTGSFILPDPTHLSTTFIPSSTLITNLLLISVTVSFKRCYIHRII